MLIGILATTIAGSAHRRRQVDAAEPTAWATWPPPPSNSISRATLQHRLRGDRLRLPLHRSVRQHRHAGGGGQEGDLFDQAHQIPRINRILFSDAIGHHRGIAHRHFDRGQLYRKRGRRGRRRTHRRHRHRHRTAVHRGALRRARRRRDSRRRHRARADHRGQHDGLGGRARSPGTIPKWRSRHSSP